MASWSGSQQSELTQELQQSERERERDRGTEWNLMTETLSTYIIQEHGDLFIYKCMNMVMCVMCESERAHVSPWECTLCASVAGTCTISGSTCTHMRAYMCKCAV